MGGDQLAVLCGRGPPCACALFSLHCRGLGLTGRGFQAHAHSWCTAGTVSMGRGLPGACALFLTALRSLLCGCASLAPSRKLESWAGGLWGIVGCHSLFLLLPSAGSHSPQVFVLWHCTASVDRSWTVQALCLSVLWQPTIAVLGLGDYLCGSLE